MRIRVTFSEMPDRFALGLNEQESFALKFDEGMLCHCVPYEGSYDIRPGLLAQTLPTNDRHLHEDILVRAIPYTEVSNIQHPSRGDPANRHHRDHETGGGRIRPCVHGKRRTGR